MENVDKFLQDLTCPIGLELFDDPITVPCCGKAMSRKPLTDWLKSHQPKRCPLCNGDLSKFNANTAQTNKNLLSFVEMIKKGLNSKNKEEKNDISETEAVTQEWSLQVNKMNFGNKEMDIAELKLYLNNCLFELNESLFIIVVDKSGSMAGNPWKQVQTALIHILGIAKSNQLIKTVIISYASHAYVLANPTSENIKLMQSGGGTNFINAFKEVDTVLIDYIKQTNLNNGKENDIEQQKGKNLKNVSILFLTDGEDTSGPRNNQILKTFNDIINKYNGICNIAVHTIGFGQHCDKSFLEELRLSGTGESGKNGTFRYSEPSDNDDALCTKLKSLFREISHRSTVDVNLKIETNDKSLPTTLFSFYQSQNNYPNEINIAFPLNSDKTGQYSQWIKLNNPKMLQQESENKDECKDNNNRNCVLIINSAMDNNRAIEIKPENIVTVAHNKKDKLFNEWIVKMIDQISNETYNLSNKIYSNYDANTFELHCALLQQRIDALQVSTKSPELQSKIEYLIETINSLRQGKTINLGKIADARFSSKFTNINNNNAFNRFYNPAAATSSTNINNNNSNDNNNNKGSKRNRFGYSYIAPVYLNKYSFNNEGRNRNKLEEMIVNLGYSSDVDKSIIEMIYQSTKNDLTHCDNDGNNALLLACYCGRFNVVKAMLPVYNKMIDKFDINQCKNKKNETGLDLAIKKRGYWKTMQILFKFGAKFNDKEHQKSLEKYASDEGYLITAQMISTFDENNENMMQDKLFDNEMKMNDNINIVSKVDATMSESYIEFLYKQSIKNDIKIDLDSYLHACLEKQMIPMIKTLLNDHNAIPTIDMLLNHCLPPKPDDKNVEKYLNLCKLLCQSNKNLIYETNSSGETPLYKACESGNLPIVEYFVSLDDTISNPKETIDKCNNDGITPLYLSCLKLYPCIMKELIMNNANVNFINEENGNTPLFAVIEREHPNLNPNIADLLLSTNKVDFSIVNKNGDSLILVACRYGHAKILEFLLNYLSLSDLTDTNYHQSQTDGFNPWIASIVANSTDCIQILYDFGLNINEKFNDSFNFGRTALHTAVIHKKPECVNKLIELGCDVNIQDNNGQIALTHAILLKNANNAQINIIKLLRNGKSNIMLKDKFGQTPLSYCGTLTDENNKTIKKLLVNPAIDILMKLVKGEFNNSKNKNNNNKEELACTVLNNHIGMCGLLSTSQCVNIIDFDGTTLLTQAILYGKVNMVKLLINLGANPYIENNFGINSLVFAKWNKNVAINKVLKEYFINNKNYMNQEKDEKVELCLKRLTISAQECNMNSFILHILNMPNELKSVGYNGVKSRMNKFDKFVNGIKQSSKTSSACVSNDNEEANNGAISFHIEKAFCGLNEKDIESMLWHSKLFTVNTIASIEDNNNKLMAVHIFLINLFSNNDSLMTKLNENLNDNKDNNLNNITRAFTQALDLLPCYKGECCFEANNNIDKSKFLVGSTLKWPYFVSATGMENVNVTETKSDQESNDDNDDTKNNSSNNKNDSTMKFVAKGNGKTTFVISAMKNGKQIADYSSFSHENEIVFLPHTTFVVEAWYTGQDWHHRTEISQTQIKEFLNSNQKMLFIKMKEK